jgi:polysaccharide export outer membrane protein
MQDSKNLPQYKTINYEDYKIQVNDELLLRVISTDDEFIKMIDAGSNVNQQNMISYRVYPDGTIDLPFIDSVKVANSTVSEAAIRIQDRFRQIVPDAEVKLTLANKSYTVIGEAGNGIFPIYKDRLTIYQALAQSGEIALSGDRKHVKIIREKDGKPEILEFDIRPKSVIDSKYYYVYPNDIIYVQKENASFYKSNNYGTFIGIITSSISLFTTVLYYTKLK